MTSSTASITVIGRPIMSQIAAGGGKGRREVGGRDTKNVENKFLTWHLLVNFKVASRNVLGLWERHELNFVFPLFFKVALYTKILNNL